jgi:hypothetical protein
VVAAITDGLFAPLSCARVARIGQGHMISMTGPGRLAECLEEFWKGR